MHITKITTRDPADLISLEIEIDRLIKAGLHARYTIDELDFDMVLANPDHGVLVARDPDYLLQGVLRYAVHRGAENICARLKRISEDKYSPESIHYIPSLIFCTEPNAAEVIALDAPHSETVVGLLLSVQNLTGIGGVFLDPVRDYSAQYVQTGFAPSDLLNKDGYPILSWTSPQHL